MKNQIFLFALFAFSFSISTVFAQWKQTSLNSGAINCFAVSGNNIFAGTHSNGVYLSSNNGTSWATVNNGLPITGNWITALAINGNNIFAGTENNGVYLSSNNGGLWTAMDSGLTNNTINALAIKGDTIFEGGSKNS